MTCWQDCAATPTIAVERDVISRSSAVWRVFELDKEVASAYMFISSFERRELRLLVED